VQTNTAGIEQPRRSRARTIRLLAFGGIGAAFLWAIATHSFVATLAESNPARALLIRSNDTAAMLALAERGASETEVRAWARAVLAEEPGNARALAILGDLARKAGDENAARAIFGASARRSSREPIVLGWQIDEALQHQDWPRAVERLDTLMRFYWQSVTPLTPLLAKLLQNRDAAPAILKALAAEPEWRREFIPRLLDAVADARVPLELFLALKATGSPPTAGELRPYLNFLIERQYYDLAYYTWLQFLDTEQLARVGLLFNGSFERRPSGLPFDWTFAREKSGDAAIGRRTDKPSERALVITFGQGRGELDDVAQLMRLQPGRYRVEGISMGTMRGSRGMRWRVRCHSAPTRQVGESAMIGGPRVTWSAFSFELAVPEEGCSAQELRLVLDARSPSEQLVSGSISFDEMSVRRVP